MFGKFNKIIFKVFAAGTLFGILFWGGYHTVIEETNTLDFLYLLS
jgi:hypothetical protein